MDPRKQFPNLSVDILRSFLGMLNDPDPEIRTRARELLRSLDEQMAKLTAEFGTPGSYNGRILALSQQVDEYASALSGFAREEDAHSFPRRKC